LKSHFSKTISIYKYENNFYGKLFNNLLEILLKEKFLIKSKENTWENYLRRIEKYLICIEDVRKIKLNELKDTYKIHSEKKIKIANLKLNKYKDPTNYFTNFISKEKKIMNKFNNIIEQNEKILSLNLDKLEYKIIDFLNVCEKNIIFIDNKKFEEKFNKLFTKAFKLISKFITIFFIFNF